ncbi:MAG: hypothetical protein ACE5FG_02165 [Myxococcota bacterium]
MSSWSSYRAIGSGDRVGSRASRVSTPLPRRAAARPARSAARLRFLVAALAILLLAGCVSVGRFFPVDAVTQLRDGETTRERCLRLFGPPLHTGVTDGLRHWTYRHRSFALWRLPWERELVLHFDENGVLRSYEFESSFPDDQGL